jgi:MraZ protein
MNGDWSSLAVYPEKKWRHIWDELSAIRETDSKGMKYKRLILANSMNIDALDAQGRFVLSRTLKARAGIESPSNKVVIIGMGDYLEIWDEEKYTAKESESIEEMNELVDYVDSINK